MPTLVRTLIATTAGPIAVERIAAVNLLKQSRVYVWGGREPMDISTSYHNFVGEWISRLPKLDRESRFRLDLSGEIHDGNSWQFATFVAHALQSVGRLAGRDDADAAATVLAATGQLDSALGVGSVGYVEKKLRLIRGNPGVLTALRQGRRVVVAVPEGNAAEARLEIEELGKIEIEVHVVRHVEDLLAKLDVAVRPRVPDDGDAWHGSPFRGLAVFDVRHRRIFCGRNKAREEAHEKLREQALAGCSFLLIHGSSGVGKSSLARAGLLADLQETASANDAWRSAIVLPSRGGSAPLDALAKALTDALPALRLSSDELAGHMRANTAAAAARIADAIVETAAQGRIRRIRIALLVDQLEELLLWAREGPDPAAARDRDVFAEMLARLARTRLVWIIATLRSDLIALVEDCPALSDLASSERQYQLQRPTAGELDEMIRRPAELAGLRFVDTDPKTDLPLIDVLTYAARRQQDCLPLLQFTLQLLYEDKGGQPKTISYAQYVRIGGLENAIGTWADRTVAALDANDDTKVAIDEVIFNLARRGRDTTVVLAVDFAPSAAFLTPARQQVIAALEQARLIVPGADERTQQRTIRVAHEALLTNWSRARNLFKTHEAKLVLKDDIERDALRWDNQHRDPTFLILGKGQVAESEQLLSDPLVALSVLAHDYVRDSIRNYSRKIASVKERLARDLQKVTDLISSGDYAEAEKDLDRIASYLENETDSELEVSLHPVKKQRARVGRLAEYSRFSRIVFQKAGEEDFEQARLNCEAALTKLCVLTDETWWEQLPIKNLSPEQITDLRQDIYRMLALHSGLQIVPGLVALFPRQRSVSQTRIPSWASGILLRIVPQAAIAAILRRGGLGPLRLPTRQDNDKARAAFDKCRDALAAVHRMEHADGGQSLQVRLLVERLVAVFSELAAGPKGGLIDFSALLSSRAATFAEPVNAADYFLIGLFNFFVAKRAGDGAAAAFLSLLKGTFPELDPNKPLATAERLLRVATELEPRNYWPHWLLGRTLLEAKDFGGAQLSFNTAIALEPRYARGYEQRAVALAKQWSTARDDRLRERALRDSRLARRVADGDPSVFWLELEQDILSRVARSEGVNRLLRRTSAIVGDQRLKPLYAAARALRALAHWTRDEQKEALEDANAALALDPRHQHALVAKGAALLKLGELERALAEGLYPALAVNPRNFLVLFLTASALEGLDRIDDARDAWETLLERAEQEMEDRCPHWISAIALERRTSLGN
jgi:tetratricopeptide (TPR) repeat protein